MVTLSWVGKWIVFESDGDHGSYDFFVVGNKL